MRVKRGVNAHKKHKNLIKKTKGFIKTRRKFRNAKQAVLKAGQYAYRDRRNKKRVRRRLWIVQINGALKNHGLSYSNFINGLLKAKVEIDRKILSSLANNNPESFEKVVNLAKNALDIVKIK